MVSPPGKLEKDNKKSTLKVKEHRSIANQTFSLRENNLQKAGNMEGQPTLFEVPENNKDVTDLDELFNQSRLLRTSQQFYELLNFITKFRQYSIFNNKLVFTQNPNVTYYATAKHWRKQFKRAVKEDARPMVILAPMHPVLFVFDLEDTVGPLPKYWDKPFATKGDFNSGILTRTIQNCKSHDWIEVKFTPKSFLNAGAAIRYLFQKNPITNGTKVEIEINQQLAEGSAYTTLCHELAHIYLGHLGNDKDDWWPDRQTLTKSQEELEAEAVSFLVAGRVGLETRSAEYLSLYLSDESDLKKISLHHIIKTATLFERMGKRKLQQRKPKA